MYTFTLSLSSEQTFENIYPKRARLNHAATHTATHTTTHTATHTATHTTTHTATHTGTSRLLRIFTRRVLA